jgi:regulator of cell morphogenesis and NO signaling
MNNLLEQTLSQIVTEHHQAAQVFEKYGLDFCCKGKRPLISALEEKELNKQTVLSDLEAAFGKTGMTADYDAMSLTELSEYIVRVHHTYVKLNSPQIYNYVLKVASKHGERYPHMKEVYALFTDVMTEMESHMEKEEKILFPRIKQLEIPELAMGKTMEFISGPIDVMEAEHESAGGAMEKIREITNNYTPPEDACTTHRVALESLKAFEEDLHQHVHLENNILFPKALAKLEKLNSVAAN